VVGRVQRHRATYGLETEVEGIRRLADRAGFETFHIVGYSAGGASSLAFASRYPERLRSLALMEPAWAGRTAQSAVAAVLGLIPQGCVERTRE